MTLQITAKLPNTQFMGPNGIIVPFPSPASSSSLLRYEPQITPRRWSNCGRLLSCPGAGGGCLWGDRMTGCNGCYALDVCWGLFGILPFPYLLFKPKHYFKWWQWRLGCPLAAGPGDQEGIPESGGDCSMGRCCLILSPHWEVTNSEHLPAFSGWPSSAHWHAHYH